MRRRITLAVVFSSLVALLTLFFIPKETSTPKLGGMVETRGSQGPAGPPGRQGDAGLQGDAGPPGPPGDQAALLQYGGTPAGTVFTSVASLQSYMSSLNQQVPITVDVDTSFGDITDVFSMVFPAHSRVRGLLNESNGAQPRIPAGWCPPGLDSVEGVLLDKLTGRTMFSTDAVRGFRFVDTTIWGEGGGVFTVATASLVVDLENTSFTTFGGAVVMLTAPGIPVTVNLTRGSVLGTGFFALSGGAVASQITLNADPSSDVSAAPGGAVVNFTHTAPRVLYAPASVPNWNGSAPADVADALDRLAAKVGPVP